MVPPSSPLWQQLQLVARIIDGVRQGRSLPQQLEQIDSAQRPGVQALSFHALRWLGLAEGVRSQLVRRMPPPLADALLCTSLALALEPDLAPAELARRCYGSFATAWEVKRQWNIVNSAAA